MGKIWLVTGSSRGFGRSLAEAILRHGDCVVATARNLETLKDLQAEYGDRILPFRLDVTDAAQGKAAIAAAVKTFGRLDVLVNNAGYALMGAVEELSDGQFAGQINANFWGVVHMCRAALPVMREQRSGYIMQFSSVGGRQANPGLSAYQAAKFAVEGFSEALAQEIKPLGIRLTVIEPGGFRTDWGGESMAFAQPMVEYAPTAGAVAGYIRANAGHEPGDPSKAAQVLLQLAEMAEPPLRLPLGSDAVGILREIYRKNLVLLEEWAALSESTDFETKQSPEDVHPVLKIGT
jgi:NAD(P)-dependent dehydrogenase (short-subunit alcohol dehydrogenase family)